MKDRKIRITEQADDSVIEPGEVPGVNAVFLIIKEIKMQKAGQSNEGVIYYHNMIILKHEEYQYFYKVNSDPEKEQRHYKFDQKLENGIDEWNKIWIGYCFNYKEDVVEQQLNLGHEISKPQVKLNHVLEKFKLVEDYDLLKKFIMKNNDANKKSIIERLVLRSNYLIFEFSEEFIYDSLRNSMNDNQNEIIDFQKQLNEEIKPFKEQFELHQKNHQNYINNLNKVLEELIQDASQVPNEQILQLLTSIEIPQIMKDPIFEKCKQSLILINNKLKDLTQKKQKIQDQYDDLKMASDQEQYQAQNQYSLIDYRDEINFSKEEELIQNTLIKKTPSTYRTNQINIGKIYELFFPFRMDSKIDPIFKQLVQTLININNKLIDLTQDKQKIQDQYDVLKIAYVQEQQRFQNQHQNSTSLNLNDDFDYLKYEEKESQTQFLRLKFEHQQQIYYDYTKNMNSILEELIQATNYISDQQIKNLSTPIEIPQINTPIFQERKQSLIIINNKLKDLEQNQLRIQDQYDNLKIEKSIQQLNDYAQTIQKNDKNQIIINKLKLVLIEKLEEIKKLKKEQNLSVISYRKRIIEAKKQYQEDIQKLEQKLIDLIEQQKDQSIKINLDTDRKIKLLEVEQARIKDLIREKDSLLITQSDYVTTLLKQIQNQKEELKLLQS